MRDQRAEPDKQAVSDLSYLSVSEGAVRARSKSRRRMRFDRTAEQVSNKNVGLSPQQASQPFASPERAREEGWRGMAWYARWTGTSITTDTHRAGTFVACACE